MEKKKMQSQTIRYFYATQSLWTDRELPPISLFLLAKESVRITYQEISFPKSFQSLCTPFHPITFWFISFHSLPVHPFHSILCFHHTYFHSTRLTFYPFNFIYSHFIPTGSSPVHFCCFFIPFHSLSLHFFP